MGRPKKVGAVEAVHIAAEAATQKWLKDYSGTCIEDRVKEMLDKSVDELIIKTIGFSNDWGKWEVDHCNGRAGESMVGDWMRGQVKDKVEAWLEEITGKFPTAVPAGIKASMKKEYMEQMTYQLRDMIRDRATKDAEEVLEQLMGDGLIRKTALETLKLDPKDLKESGPDRWNW
jgi:hypothetical protein